MRSPPVAGLAALLAGACTPDPPPLLDGGSQQQCLIPSSYGMLGTKTGTADSTTPNSLTVLLDPGPPRDDFFIKLVAGNGAFAGGGLKTGTFPISGADASRASCGVCISLIADIVANQGPTKFYFADSGTITLTTANATGSTPSMIAGSAQNLHFVEVDAAGTPLSGGCSSLVASIAFGPM